MENHNSTIRFWRMAWNSGSSRGRKVVAELDGVLVVGDFGRMQTAIDVNDRLDLARQGARLLLVDTARQSQAAGEVLMVLELREVFRVGDEGDEPVAALRGFADVHELDPIGGGGEFLEVSERLLVVGELEIGAGLVAENGLGSGRLGGGEGERQEEQELLHGSTASLYCSRRSSSFEELRSLARRSTMNFRSCAAKAA